MYFNKYQRISDDYNQENVLNGWDYQLSSQIPYLHWASAFINEYRWDGVLRDDIRGKKMGSDMLLTPNLNMEVAYDDKDKSGLADEWYSKLQFFHPPRANEPTALDGVSATKWKENKDMSGELLSKVKRQNKIMIEFKGYGGQFKFEMWSHLVLRYGCGRVPCNKLGRYCKYIYHFRYNC